MATWSSCGSRTRSDRPVLDSQRSADAFKKRLSEALRNLDLSSLDEADRKIMAGAGITRLVLQSDGAYDGIRDLVKPLNIDLQKLS